MLIRSPEGRIALIDAGVRNDITETLEAMGVSSIDLIGVSHHHLDHFGGMDAIIPKFNPRFFMATTSQHTGDQYDALLTQVGMTEMGVISIAPGDPSRRITLGTVVLTLLPQPPEHDNENNNSIGIRIEHGDASVLITGDSEDAERAFWLDPANGALDLIRDCDVLKLAHHGSQNGTDQAWLDVIKPKVAVVSLGAGNQFGHPDEETLQLVAAAGVPLRRTDIHRTITLRSFGERFELVEGEVTPAGPLRPVSTRVDLNGATEAELDALPGIGPVLAQRIIAARPFVSVDDLARVEGIGSTRLEILRPLVRVGAP